MSGKLITLTLASALLSGCVSMTAYDTIKRAEHLCKNRFTYEIYSTLKLKPNENFYLKQRENNIPDWLRGQREINTPEWLKGLQVVIYEEERSVIYRESGGRGSIEEVKTKYFNHDNNELLATLITFNARSAPLFLGAHPASYSCDLYHFNQALKGANND